MVPTAPSTGAPAPERAAYTAAELAATLNAALAADLRAYFDARARALTLEPRDWRAEVAGALVRFAPAGGARSSDFEVCVQWPGAALGAKGLVEHGRPPAATKDAFLRLCCGENAFYQARPPRPPHRSRPASPRAVGSAYNGVMRGARGGEQMAVHRSEELRAPVANLMMFLGFMQVPRSPSPLRARRRVRPPPRGRACPALPHPRTKRPCADARGVGGGGDVQGNKEYVSPLLGDQSGVILGGNNHLCDFPVLGTPPEVAS